MYLGPYQRPAQLHSATAQQSPYGSSMKGLCAVVGTGTTANLYIVQYFSNLQQLKSTTLKHTISPLHQTVHY